MKPDYLLLKTFRELFDGKKYNHRDSSLGDRVACSLYDDLFNLGKSSARVRDRVSSSYDEFLFLCFAATNVSPFPFEWMEEQRLIEQYGALLTRISRKYDERFS